MKKYYVTNSDNIPFHAQPAEGYTLDEAKARVTREINECVALFGGVPADYETCFYIKEV